MFNPEVNTKSYFLKLLGPPVPQDYSLKMWKNHEYAYQFTPYDPYGNLGDGKSVVSGYGRINRTSQPAILAVQIVLMIQQN